MSSRSHTQINEKTLPCLGSQINEEDWLHIGRVFVTCFSMPPWNENWQLGQAIAHLQHLYGDADWVIRRTRGEVIAFACGGSLELPSIRENVQSVFVPALPQELQRPQSFYFGELCVRPDRQGKGHGRQLASALIEEARKSDQRFCFAATAPGHAPMHSILPALGLSNSMSVKVHFGELIKDSILFYGDIR